MTSPDERADNNARNDAIKLVDDALRSGRIVQADHDMRIDQLRNAQTMQDVDLQVRDLRAPGQPPAGQQWPLVNYGPGSASSAEVAHLATAVGKSGTSGKLVGGIIAFVVLLAVVVPVAGAAIAFFAARDSFPDFGSVGPTDETTYLPGQTPGEDGVNVHTVDGYHDMVDALRDETGATYVFTAVLYPRYAVLDVPTGTNQRYEAFYWDGETLEKNTSRGSLDQDQVDLSLVDPQLVVDMLDLVRGRLDSADSWYVVISDYGVDQEAQISAYASNDFGESTYIVNTLGGDLVYDSEGTPATPEEPA